MSEERKALIPDYVSNMVETESTDLARDNMDIFIQQMLEAAPGLFQQALDIAKQSAEFRADVFTKLSREIHDATKANDAMGQKVIDDAYQNNELTRKIIVTMLADGQISPEELEFLFRDLRFYHNEMKEMKRETQAERERMLKQEKEAAEMAAEQNGIGGYMAGAIATFLAGLSVGWYLWRRK